MLSVTDTSHSILTAELLRYLTFFAGTTIDIVVVLGSGLGDFADTLEEAQRVSYSSLPDFPRTGIAGHTGELVFGRIAGNRVLVFIGRVHAYEGHTAATLSLPAEIAAYMGARCFLATNAAGGLNPLFRIGDLMLMTDIFILPTASHLVVPCYDTTGCDNRISGTYFQPECLKLARDAAITSGTTLREGVYGFTSGPSYETRAEITQYRFMGADAIGMSTVPELLNALRHGLCTLGISCITNKAATIPQRITHDEVTTIATRVSERFSMFLQTLLGKI